jgi:hypothetical protein
MKTHTKIADFHTVAYGDKPYRCIVLLHDLGYYTGYIQVPKSNPIYGMNYMNIQEEYEISCHGGITFGELIDDTGSELPEGYWIGFDCLHAGDAPEPKLAEIYFNKHIDEDLLIIYKRGKFRDFSYVTSELESLAKQLYKIESRHN